MATAEESTTGNSRRPSGHLAPEPEISQNPANLVTHLTTEPPESREPSSLSKKRQVATIGRHKNAPSTAGTDYDFVDQYEDGDEKDYQGNTIIYSDDEPFREPGARRDDIYEYEDESLYTRTKRRRNASSSKRRRKKDPRRTNEATGGKINREGFSAEYNIKLNIQRNYDKTSRPVKNDSSPLDVFIGMSLYHILDTDERFQTLAALIAVRVRWSDDYLRWDPAEYNNVTQIWLPALDIWRPDIFINNFADDSFQDFMNTFAIIQYNGDVLWMFPAVVKTYCTLDVRHFPFDRQTCNIIFISWTFNGLKLNISTEMNFSSENTVYYTPKNQEWYVDKISVVRNTKIYACCPEPYPDVTFSIHMTRRSLFYIVNLIFPCLLIYAVAFLGFFLPIESGEKVNLEITILLALVVFLLIVGETLPPTPDAIPALGLLFGTTMLMVSIALVMAVIVTNLYLRKDSGKRIPACLRKVFIRGKQRRRSSLCNRVTSAENHVMESKMAGEIEIDNLSLHSEVETLTCRNHRCASTRRRGSAYKAPDAETLARTSQEWQQLAQCVDRIFFWVFFLSSIGALGTMFFSIPRYRPS